jgi:PKD repeat protein
MLAPIANGTQPPSVFALGTDPAGDVVATWQRPDDTPAHYSGVEALIYDASPPVLGDMAAPAGGTIGQTLAFSTVASDAFSPVSLEWTLGDGASGAGEAITHAYGAAGSYEVAVTAADTAGNVSPATTRTIVVTSGVPGAPVVESFAIDPSRFAVAKAKAARARASVSRGTTLHFTLSQAGTVEISFVRVRLSRRCPGSPRPRRCERTKPMGTLTLDAAAGANAVPFGGRLDGKALPRGRYRATLVATTAGALAPSAVLAADFTVVRR